ncbi:MAG: GtrA family protein [Cyanobacteria bacterium P01_C01_bin.120]
MHKLSKPRAKKTRRQLFQYLFVGGIATVVDVGMFSLFTQAFGIDYRIAVVLGFCFGVLTNFSLCNWIVFAGKRKPLWLVFVRHYIASLSVLVSNEIMMISFVEIFNFKNLVLAKIISSGVAFVFNFALKKAYVYNDANYKRSASSPPMPTLTERRSQR